MHADTRTEAPTGYQQERYAVRLAPGQRQVLVLVDVDLERRRRETWEANEQIERQ